MLKLEYEYGTVTHPESPVWLDQGTYLELHGDP